MNDVISVASPKAFAADIVHLLSETSMLDRLRAGTKVSVKNFSVEKMVEKYLDGLGALISSGPERPSVQSTVPVH